MQQDLSLLSEKELLQKLHKHYLKINKYRGPSLRPILEKAHFIKTKDGKEFLVGSTGFFEAERVYGKDDAHNIVGSTPYLSSSSCTFAVMVEKGHLTDTAFEIEANSYETHVTDYTPSGSAETIRINGRLMSQIPAKTSIGVMKHQGDTHSSLDSEYKGFNNVADRRKILDVLNGKNKPYHVRMLTKTSLSSSEYHNEAKVPIEIVKICTDLITPIQKDIEAAQDYRHHLNMHKKPTSTIGNLINKTWFALRSKLNVSNK